MLLMKVEPAGKISNLDVLYPIKVGTAVLRAIVTDRNVRNFARVYKLRRKIRTLVGIVANLK